MTQKGNERRIPSPVYALRHKKIPIGKEPRFPTPNLGSKNGNNVTFLNQEELKKIRQKFLLTDRFLFKMARDCGVLELLTYLAREKLALLKGERVFSAINNNGNDSKVSPVELSMHVYTLAWQPQKQNRLLGVLIEMHPDKSIHVRGNNNPVVLNYSASTASTIALRAAIEVSIQLPLQLEYEDFYAKNRRVFLNPQVLQR